MVNNLLLRLLFICISIWRRFDKENLFDLLCSSFNLDRTVVLSREVFRIYDAQRSLIHLPPSRGELR